MEKEKIPPSGLQTILGDANALAQLSQLFFGGKGETTTSSTTIAPGGLEAMYRTALEDVQGLSAVSRGQRTAGLYGSPTNQLLTNDFLTRTAGEIARSTASKTEQKSNPRQLDPGAMLLGTAALQGLKRVNWDQLGDDVSSFFGGGPSVADNWEAMGGFDAAGPTADYDFSAGVDNFDFGFEDLDFGSYDFGDSFFEDFSDFDFGYRNGGRVKKNYADGGRALPNIYSNPDSSLSLSRRGIVSMRPSRTPISPVRIARPAPERRGRDPLLDQDEQLVAKLALMGRNIGGVPVGAPIGGLNRMTRGRPEDLEEGAGQAIGSTVGAVLGSAGGHVGAALGSAAGGKFGEDVLGGMIGGFSQAAEDIPDTLDKLTGGSVSFLVNPFSKLFANGGYVVPGAHDRTGQDKVNINVGGGEMIIPTDVVDALGQEFFDQIISMFHKEIK